MRYKTSLTALVILAALAPILQPVSARATTVAFTSFLPGDLYVESAHLSVRGPDHVNPLRIGLNFIATATITLEQIEVPLQHVSGATGIELAIHADSLGSQPEPGAVLEAVSLTSPATMQIMSVAFDNGVVLLSGEKYWITLKAFGDGFTEWLPSFNGAATSDHDTRVSSDEGAVWNASPRRLGVSWPAARVSGVPEPSRVLLIGLALATGLLARRRAAGK